MCPLKDSESDIPLRLALSNFVVYQYFVAGIIYIRALPFGWPSPWVKWHRGSVKYWTFWHPNNVFASDSMSWYIACHQTYVAARQHPNLQSLYRMRCDPRATHVAYYFCTISLAPPSFCRWHPKRKRSPISVDWSPRFNHLGKSFGWVFCRRIKSFYQSLRLTDMALKNDCSLSVDVDQVSLGL